MALTSKQRMLNAYRGIANDFVAIAPEFWYYYPAKVLGVDMLEFGRDVPFHQALKITFEKFGCEGWGASFVGAPNEQISSEYRETWIDDETLESRSITHTPLGDLTSANRGTRAEPGWCIERQVKDLARDLPAWELAALGGNPEAMDCAGIIRAWEEVGESYLLEAWIGVPFFDFYAGGREGGFETAIYDFLDPELTPLLERLQAKYIEYLQRMTQVICARTPYESLAIGCSWSCNSLIGPDLWRRWDKPVIAAVAEEVHRQGRLLHVHFHGKCRETVADFAEIGIDCVCPFERPPGGDIATVDDLRQVEQLLRGKTTMNGNLHTVDTLIRGTTADVRREVTEVLTTFANNPRVILGTGDQVGRETPEENLWAMIETGRALGRG